MNIHFSLNVVNASIECVDDDDDDDDDDVK